MDTTKRSPLDRLLFATFLKGKRSIITHQGQKKKHLGQEVQKIR